MAADEKLGALPEGIAFTAELEQFKQSLEDTGR